MSRAIQPHIITDDSVFSGKIIGGSLAFSRACNDYLKRTPSVSGNQKRWTWSAWVKVLSQAHTQYLFSTDRYSGTNDGHAAIYVKTNGRIETYFDSTSSNTYGDVNEFTLHDKTAWYHIVWRVDSNNSSHRIWVNGKEQSASNGPANYNFGMNRAGTQHALATSAWSFGNSADMLMAEVHHVDGTLYEASHFGFFESSTGKWVPKSSEVIKANTTYGTNGYYLPMDGSGAIGEDQSGNNNHWTPNKPHQNSISMDKATGGLPILDTNTGGTNLANFFQTRQDPFAANCVLAIPMVNGSRYQVRDFSAVVRGSGSNKTLTVSGTDVSERHWVHTGVSRYFDGSNDSISIPDSSDFTFDGDFCIEMWIKPTSVSGTRRLISSEQSGANPAFIFRLDGNKFSAYLKASGGQQSYMTSSNYTLNTDEWYHLAMTRESGSFRTFVNGILDQTSTYTHTVDVNSTVEIGRYVIGSEYYVGYMQDVRVYKGVAKYTKSFVPQTISFAHNPGAHTGWITPDTPTGTAAGRIFNNMRFTSGSVCFDGQGSSTTQQSALSIADSADFYFDADFTMECYFFRGVAASGAGALFGQWVSGGGAERQNILYHNANGTLSGFLQHGGSQYRVDSDEIKSGYWNHVAMVLQGSTLRLYVNGVQVSATTGISGSPNNSTIPFFIGAESNSSSQSIYSYSGLISNVRVVKGVAVYPDGTQFTPSSTPLTNITGTVLLCCQSKDSPTAAAVTPSAIQIHSTANTKPCSCNFNPFDKLDNAPQESNYCVLGNDKDTNANIGAAGLYWSCNNASSGVAVGTHSFTSGKYYFETETNSTNRYHVGVMEVDGVNGIKHVLRNQDFGDFSNEWGYRIDGYTVNNGGEVNISPNTSTAYTGQTQMIAVDADNGKIYFGRDGIWLNGANPEHGENPHYSNLSGRLAPAFGRRTDSNSARINFGQSPFRFPPPVGYKTICSSNIKPPSINSKNHFGILTYTGNGAVSGHQITGLTFQPDFVWIKNRSHSYDHHLYDVIRGVGNWIESNSDDTEAYGIHMDGFLDNGFSVGNGVQSSRTNVNGNTYVGWCWKAGSPLTATNGSVRYDANGDYLSLASTSDFDFGTGDFTLELYFKCQGYSNTPYLLEFRATGGAESGSIVFYVTSAGKVTFWYAGADRILSNNTITLRKWTHVALVRSSGTTKMYIDGVAQTSTYSDSNDYGDGGRPLFIGVRRNSGSSLDNQSWNGSISNVRIVKGTAVYTSNFTPSTTPLTNITNTKLLCCQSTESAGDAAVAPLVSGINDGTLWSNYLTNSSGGFQSNYPASNAFNGVTTGANTSRSSNNQITQTFAPPNGISYSSSVEVWTWYSGSVSLNGGSNITVNNDQSFRQIASGSGTINNIRFITDAGNSAYVAGIRVDGTILLDPMIVNDAKLDISQNPFDAFSKNGIGYASASAAEITNGTISLTGASVSQEAGFSIVSWTGDGNVNSTVGHGLDGRPDLIFVKSLTSGYYWRVYHRYYGNDAGSGLYLNEQNSSTNHDNQGGIKLITNTTFGFGTNGTNDLGGVNASGHSYIAYCWKAVEGHSAFGSYYGSSTNPGPYINLGFEPSFILRKKISGVGDWIIMDSTRHSENIVNNRILANVNSTEQGNGNNIDIYANGYQERNTDGYSNSENAIYIYAAWGKRSHSTPFGIHNEGRGWG
tara:strand:- start:38 stop:5056 length:5019 start_codon:yes stop_codon:yes gene_type:complete